MSLRIATAALLALSCVLLAQNVVPPASEKVQAARKLLAQGAREEAGRTLDDAIRNNAKDGAAHLLLGEMLEEDGRAAEATQALTTAVRLLPQSAEAHNALGEALSDLNSLAPARIEFEKALQLAPALPLAHLNLGMVLAQTDELTLAAKHLDFAIAKLTASADLARAHYLRAKVYTDLSQVERAAAELSIAVKLEPEFTEAWSDLGQARKTLQDDIGALSAFERAVELSPNDPVALVRLGSELYRQGKLKPAISQLQHADSINPQDQTTLNTLQSALRADGQTAAANDVKARLVEVLRLRDLNTQNQLSAARLNSEGAKLQKEGDLKAAVDKFRQALNLDPDHIGIRVNLAMALVQLGDWNEGLSELAESMRRQPGDPALKAAWDDALKRAPPGSWVNSAGPHD